MDLVPNRLLQDLAALAPKPAQARPEFGFDLDRWIAQHALKVASSGPWAGGRKWVLNPCPWNAEHTNKAAFIVQFGNGAIAAGCHHNGCQGRDWHTLRDLLEPGWREPKQQAKPTPSTNGHAPATEPKPEPELIVPEPTPWPEPPTDEAYHGLAGEIVRLIEPQTEADPVAVLMQILVMFGNAIGRTAHFVVEEDKHYGNLFACLVGETAKGRKGTSKGRALKAFEFLTDDWARKRIASGLSSGEGLIWAVRDEIWKKHPVKSRGRVVDYQNVLEDEGIKDKRLLVAESEFVLPLRAASREGNTLTARIREAWDSGNLSTLVKNTATNATGAHISIIGHITRQELVKSMGETEAVNGFANRFLWVAVRRSKLLPMGGQPVELGPKAHKIALAVEQARSVGYVGMDTAAAEYWAHELYPKLSGGGHGLVGAITNRGESQVRRLALVYALLDFSPVVTCDHLLAALSLWDYCERSARWAWGENSGNGDADEILLALRAAGSRGMSQTEIFGLFDRHRKGSHIGAALGVLQHAQLAHCEEVSTGGRPTKRWFAGPAKKAN